jgi:YD repeat-containing protein
LLVIVFTASLLSARGQGGTTIYVYDDNGRLHAVISPSGEAALYDYDAAGNITAIRRLAADSLAILAFSPHAGLPGDQVTFTGVGFGGGVTNVSFNGASATVVSVTPSRVVATVPAAATTGPVTITTPTGSATTATPFTLVGVRITPSFAALKFGESVQLTAEVLPSTLDQDVVWTVNDVAGGNSTVGTISATGLFTAPNIKYSSLTIRATSVADSERFAEAGVTVSDPNDVQSVLSSAVSVSRGNGLSMGALAPQVAVQYGFSSESQSALATAISVQYGLLSVAQSGLAGGISVQYGDLRSASAAFSRGVSVQRGTFTQSSAFANQVAIQYGNSLGQNSAHAFVSATRGPHVQSISPGNVTRGTSVTLTVNGVGLSGATAIRFITAGGANDATITVSNIVVNADGTSLTATVTVSAGSALGSRIVFISTPNGDSVTVDLETNKINVQ